MSEDSYLTRAHGCGINIVMLPVLSVAHFAGATWLSFKLFGLAGGILTYGRWTRFGGIEYAWTNLAWLPGGMLLPAGGGPSVVGMLPLAASCPRSRMRADILSYRRGYLAENL